MGYKTLHQRVWHKKSRPLSRRDARDLDVPLNLPDGSPGRIAYIYDDRITKFCIVATGSMRKKKETVVMAIWDEEGDIVEASIELRGNEEVDTEFGLFYYRFNKMQGLEDFVREARRLGMKVNE